SPTRTSTLSLHDALPILEVGFRGGAIADPRRGDARVALDRGGHPPTHRLDVLRAEVARDGEEAVIARRVHHRHLPPLERIVAVRSEEHTSELQSRGHLVC